MAGFSLFVHITRSEFPKIAQEDRKVRLLLLFRTFCHVVYATLGSTTSLKNGGSAFRQCLRAIALAQASRSGYCEACYSLDIVRTSVIFTAYITSQ